MIAAPLVAIALMMPSRISPQIIGPRPTLSGCAPLISRTVRLPRWASAMAQREFAQLRGRQRIGKRFEEIAQARAGVDFGGECRGERRRESVASLACARGGIKRSEFHRQGCSMRLNPRILACARAQTEVRATRHRTDERLDYGRGTPIAQRPSTRPPRRTLIAGEVTDHSPRRWGGSPARCARRRRPLRCPR